MSRSLGHLPGRGTVAPSGTRPGRSGSGTWGCSRPAVVDDPPGCGDVLIRHAGPASSLMDTVTPLEGRLAGLWARSCEGKTPMSQRAARSLAARYRAAGSGSEPYRCYFGDHWHVGHPLTLAALTEIAEVLRARSGNAPARPGSGTTRRRARLNGSHRRAATHYHGR